MWGTFLSAAKSLNVINVRGRDRLLVFASLFALLLYFVGACGTAVNNGGVFRGILLVPDLNATGISSSEIRLQWQDISDNPSSTELVIQQKTGSQNFSDVAVLSSDQTSYTSSGLASHTTYVFRVVVQDTQEVYETQTSSVVTAQTLGPLTPTPSDL